jgi:hypothetical protein
MYVNAGALAYVLYEMAHVMYVTAYVIQVLWLCARSLAVATSSKTETFEAPFAHTDYSVVVPHLSGSLVGRRVTLACHFRV